ncbi:hypothetical protein GOBAR_AA35252 [Gossypium barbadense]|uniref:SHSP domain-containing protein n=1 Tax=Gossypium barbadense TaxID=3634 RepID=A0A2P5W2W1_GOSBA|nr:hypothetical protein GOBAR_AA35252 [Gossypium barbadense]
MSQLIPSLFGGRRTNVFDPFSLDVWDPLFSSALANNVPSSARETAAIVNARIDWKETPQAHVIKADLPGLKKEQVKVERSSGKFMRRFRLPENAVMDQIKASMEDGVLTVTAPKKEDKKPQVKTIDISG